MTEQYEQITGWDELIQAAMDKNLYWGKEKMSGLHLDAGNFQSVKQLMDAGKYYCKVEHEQVELEEWEHGENPSCVIYTAKGDCPSSDYLPTNYIIKGVRVKA